MKTRKNILVTKSILCVIFIWLHCEACGILVPQPVTEPGPWQWKHEVLTTGLPGSSCQKHFKIQPQIHISFYIVTAVCLLLRFEKCFFKPVQFYCTYLCKKFNLSFKTLNTGYFIGLSRPLWITRYTRTAPHKVSSSRLPLPLYSGGNSPFLWSFHFCFQILFLGLESFLSDPSLVKLRKGVKSEVGEDMSSKARYLGPNPGFAFTRCDLGWVVTCLCSSFAHL